MKTLHTHTSTHIKYQEWCSRLHAGSLDEIIADFSRLPPWELFLLHFFSPTVSMSVNERVPSAHIQQSLSSCSTHLFDLGTNDGFSAFSKHCSATTQRPNVTKQVHHALTAEHQHLRLKHQLQNWRNLRWTAALNSFQLFTSFFTLTVSREKSQKQELSWKNRRFKEQNTQNYIKFKHWEEPDMTDLNSLWLLWAVGRAEKIIFKQQNTESYINIINSDWISDLSWRTHHVTYFYSSI